MSADINYNLKEGIKELNKLKNEPSSFVVEERERQKKLQEQLVKEQQSKKSVLKRIKETANSLRETTYVEYRDPKEIKKEFNKLLKESKKEEEENPFLPNKGGRPRVDENNKAKKYAVSIKARISEEIERRKEKKKISRSTAIGELLELGLKYERMRESQAKDLQKQLKSFAETFSKLKIKRNHHLTWRYSEISLEENEKILATLFLRSEKIKNYLDAAGIDPLSLEGVAEHLSEKEARYLIYASTPEKIAEIVKGTGISEGMDE